jgi:hypothetical protein
MAKDLLVVTSFQSLDPNVDNPSVTFKFTSPDATDFATVNAVGTAISAMFNTTRSGSSGLSQYMSLVCSRATNASTHEFYDLTGHLASTSKHGSPVGIQSWTLAGIAGTPQSLPAEVAATVSYRADYGTDVEFGSHARPRARDRNRFYLGPLNITAIQDDATTHRAKFTNAFITACLVEFQGLTATIVSGATHWNIRVWSRVDAALKLPTIIYMDDDPDVQRRRSDPTPGTRLSLVTLAV